MVTIFEKNITEFKGLGLGALLPTSCRVTEELNAGFELTMEHPYDKYGKWERIEEERILYASTPRGMQPFRIYRANKTMTGISVNARHIFYDMQDNLSELVDHTGNAADALSHLVSTFAYAMPFSFSTNITRNGTMFGEYINPVQALLSEDDTIDSFVKVYGGELLRNGFSVSMLDTIGEDRGVSIRYRKNLIGLEVDENTSELKTRIIVKNEAGTVVMKDSPYIDAYVYPKIYIVDGGKAAINEMEWMAESLLEEGIDLPNINIKVDFQTLSKTEEYKDYALLEEVQLGDTVRVINEKMGFSAVRKVISYEWDAILEQYAYVELGDFLPSLSTTTNRVMQLVKSNLGKMTEIEVDIEGIRTSVSDTQKGLSSQIEQTAEEIRSEVTDVEKGLSSEIEQTADQISWIVSSGTSASSMKLTDEFLEIVSDNIEVTGYVTFNDLEESGSTDINGDNITTGEIAAEYINLGGLMEVHRTDVSSIIGGYIGYGTGDDGDNASTKGILLMDSSETNYFIATTSGVRMTYDDMNAVYCIDGGVYMVADDYGTVLDDSNGNFCPDVDDEQLLGKSSRLWQGLYAGNATIQTSDRRKKNSIEYNMVKYEEFFGLLKPTQYKLNNGDSNRYHVGFISQDVEEAMETVGLDSLDFAGFIKSPVHEVELKNGDYDTTTPIIDHRYALRYGEFVALNTHMIQKLMAKVEELEDRIAKLEG